MGDALVPEHPGDALGLFDGDGTHQDGLTLLVALFDLLDDGAILAGLGLVDHVGVVGTDDGLVGGDLHDIQVVDGAEFVLFGHSGTGHAGELVVEAEEVLEGDGSQGLGLVGDLQALLGFDGLMQTLVIATAEHETAGELVHDDHLVVLDHVVDVLLHDAAGADGLVDVVVDGGVFLVSQVVQVEELFCLGDAAGGQSSGLALFFHDVVVVLLHVLVKFLVVGLSDHVAVQVLGELVGHLIQLGGLFAAAGDDEWGTGFVDEDGVHFVHDGEGQVALDGVPVVDGHVVTEVVEADLVVGAVGDVGVISGLALCLGQAVDDQTDGQTQEPVDLAHPLGVTLCQVVVDGDDVDAFAGEGVEVGGQGGHQGLTFTGLHFGDTALMEDDAADELDAIGTEAQDTICRFPTGGEGFGEDVVQGGAGGQACLELVGLGAELFVGEGFVFVGQCLNFIYNGGNLFDFPLGVGSEKFSHHSHALSIPFLNPLRMYSFRLNYNTNVSECETQN